MARIGGAKDQKRVAKQKAKRAAKRSAVHQRTSKDPCVRLQHTEKWAIVQALVGEKIWEEGIGHLLIARRDTAGELVYAVFLVDVYCLGVKNAFWRTGTPADIEHVVKRVNEFENLCEATPACLAKIVTEAVDYARCFGFSPHPDFRHASKLLDGIDPSACPTEFTFGRNNGRPFYIQGPGESPAQAAAIIRVVQEAGGHFLTSLANDEDDLSGEFGPEVDEFESFDDESDEDESGSGPNTDWR